jgi:subtilisin family serine protease
MPLKTLLVCFALLVSLLVPATSLGDSGADRYIVVFKDNVDSGAVANQHKDRYDAQLKHVYRHAVKGYAATVPNAKVEGVRRDSRVDYVERDETAHAVGQALPWGIGKVGADASTTVAGNGSGSVSGVNAYVIDSGIDVNHRDLSVVGHKNFAGGKNTDCNGHGTHVAGTVAARDDSNDVVGVAPGASLTGVKVLGCNGSGSYSGVIAGVDWVTANAKKPAVANMSLGGPGSQALDTAVKNSAASGVFYALAAGNEGANACNSSPARAGAGAENGIATVAATNSGDQEASWSNYGSCVDIWAPGVSILSTRKGGGTTTMSGTSMAAPHTAGGGALWLSKNAVTPSDVERQIKDSTTPTGNPSKQVGRAITRLNVGGF